MLVGGLWVVRKVVMITREEASPHRVDTEYFLPDGFPRCFAGTLNP